MKIREYAPVIVITLNRDQHLKRCLESLSENTGAEKTDIYIAVDYPPNAKYVKGYEKVVKYLKSTNVLSKFKEAHVFYQDNNLGVSGNTEYIKNIVREKYNTYIFTEDDNEFAPNFLEYINKGLEEFQHNEDVIAINGLKDAEWQSEDNNAVAAKLFPAYGFGTWFKREDRFKAKMQETLSSGSMWKPANIRAFYKKNKFTCAQYIDGVVCADNGLFYDEQGNIELCDSTRSMYMYLSNYYCIVPTVSKSRTWGNDGSGVNMVKNTNIDPEITWKLDKERNFEYKKANIIYNSQNDRIAEEYLIRTYGKKIILSSMLQYFLLIIFRFDRKKVINIKGKLHKIKGNLG